ncbi:reverse transcriptase domain protein [Lasallia pustulata]|uniref:Reverse transcriptase domain protein n=1 Tax=Lasallia pustulata TaxID=136370 RepID=A0A1W5D768_9LECA|nr:reverse transcriptase domain protein [Lasallia pustulata]
MVPAECNYEIYDKELLAIICCLKHWHPELEATELPVEIFTDYKALDHFMTSKELTCRQVRWAENLSEYNFKIIYQTGAKNVKADALTRKPGDKPINEEDDRLKYQHQTILTPDRLEISVLEPDPEAPIHDRILNVNWDDCQGHRTMVQPYNVQRTTEYLDKINQNRELMLEQFPTKWDFIVWAGTYLEKTAMSDWRKQKEQHNHAWVTYDNYLEVLEQNLSPGEDTEEQNFVAFNAAEPNADNTITSWYEKLYKLYRFLPDTYKHMGEAPIRDHWRARLPHHVLTEL